MYYFFHKKMDESKLNELKKKKVQIALSIDSDNLTEIRRISGANAISVSKLCNHLIDLGLQEIKQGDSNKKS